VHQVIAVGEGSIQSLDWTGLVDWIVAVFKQSLWLHPEKVYKTALTFAYQQMVLVNWQQIIGKRGSKTSRRTSYLVPANECLKPRLPIIWCQLMRTL